MTSPQAQSRVDLKALLTAAPGAMPWFTYLPEKAMAPFGIIGPGPEWITFDGMPFGGRRITNTLIVFAPPGSNDVGADALDEMVETVIGVVEASGEFVTVRVNQPGQFPVNGQAHLAVTIDVANEV